MVKSKTKGKKKKEKCLPKNPTRNQNNKPTMGLALTAICCS